MDLLKKGTILAFALSAAATAAGAAGDVSFQEADRNDDGIVDATEAKELDLDVINQYDTNYDGIIERSEWQDDAGQASEADAASRDRSETSESGATVQSAADAAGVSFEEADLDGSGFIDGPEAQELDLDVVQFDSNYNGIIDRTEWERAPDEATEPDRSRENQ